MVSRPEVARVIEEFQDLKQDQLQDSKHHNQSSSEQSAFLRDVQSMSKVMEDFGDLFDEDSQDLLVLDTKKIATRAVGKIRQRMPGGENESYRKCPQK